MIYFLQERKVLKRIGCLCRSRLIGEKCAATYHPFDLAAAIGAVPSGAFVKRPLTEQYFEIALLKFFACKARAKLTLCGKYRFHLVGNHISCHGGYITAAFVALMIFKRLVKQKHLAHGAIAVLAHTLLVLIDSRQ